MLEWGKRCIHIIIFSIGMIGALLLLYIRPENIWKEKFEFIVLICVIFEMVWVIINNAKSRKKNQDIVLLEEYIIYDKKRKEIESKIELLTRELSHSDVSRYLDINRLAFDGQNRMYDSKLVNYGEFFNQFGLKGEMIEIRKDSAIFLTPFNREGERLFRICQDVLSITDIHLQKTDNYTEKADILMNIIYLIVRSEIVIVNINGRNPNVYYELGIAHALGKPTILLSEVYNSVEEIGFDIRQKRIVMYRSENELREQLLKVISNIKRNI